MRRALPWLILPTGLIIGLAVNFATDSGVAGQIVGGAATFLLVLGVIAVLRRAA
jgi:hypothetical protein